MVIRSMVKPEFSVSNTFLHGFFVPADDDLPVQEILTEKPRGEAKTSDEDTQKWREEQIAVMLGDIDYERDCRQALLVRPSGQLHGLMSYFAQRDDTDKDQADSDHNIRATTFGMTCGLLNARFVGDVVILNVVAIGRRPDKNPQMTLDDFMAACKTPDIRSATLQQLGVDLGHEIPRIIGDAVLNNYQDRTVLNKFNSAMKRRNSDEFNYSTSGETVEEYMLANSDAESEPDDVLLSFDGDAISSNGAEEIMREEVVTHVTLCYYCRRPASTLCEESGGAYFCDPPRTCKQDGWSYKCICKTWKLYTDRRAELSSVGLGSWTQELVEREFQLSNEPYENFLGGIGITKDSNSWWKAEFGGWSGGMSESAQKVDISRSLTFTEGFAPISEIPAEVAVNAELLKSKNWHNESGLRTISDWAEYYELRGIPISSPVSLLLTYPLTLFHAIVEYGKAQCAVARTMGRPLRVDVVGAEKELHFLALFQETNFLLPEDLDLELIFIVRQDMLPQSAEAVVEEAEGSYILEKNGLSIRVLSGTYGESIDPRFDCGRSGAPDMVMAFNAGLHAYETWRSCVEFLNSTKDVVGVFTDYNEWSGVQCASLGGHESRTSLKVNPFRQPRAMPVYSMNLPQFCNGFIYVFNEHMPQE